MTTPVQLSAYRHQAGIARTQNQTRFGSNPSSPEARTSQTATSETSDDLSVWDRTKRGLERLFRKTFLRPRGWLEAFGALHIVGIPFLVKSFAEGYLGVDSIILPRWISFGNKTGANVKQFGTSLLWHKISSLWKSE